MKRLYIKSIISILIIILTFVLLFYYISRHISDFQELATIGLSNFWLIFILAFLIIIALLSNGFLLDTLMRPFGLKLKIKESFGLAAVTNFYNTIMPLRGGMAARAIYLKEKYDFAYVDFLATLSAIYILIFLVGSLTGIISMLLIWYYYQIFNIIIFIAFVCFALFLLGIIVFSPKIPEPKNKWLNRFSKVINGWHLIKNNKKVILTTFIVTIIQLLLSTFSTMINYSIFDVHISFIKALFLSTIGSIAILVAITPGNLGVGDAIGVFTATLIGIGTTEAIAATILGRAVGLAVTLTLGPLFSWILFRKLKKNT